MYNESGDKMVKIIGAGLAGVEAAYYLANQNIKVKLYEMRPKKMTPAHQTGHFAELVCSNSLRSNDIHNAVGLLKHEMMEFNSLVMKAAHHASVPAGSSLAVDRALFSEYIENEIKNHPNIELQIELKAYDCEKRVIQIIKDFDMISRITIISFIHPFLVNIKNIEKQYSLTFKFQLIALNVFTYKLAL